MLKRLAPFFCNNSFGYVFEQRDADSNALLRTVNSMTSRGKTQSQTFGNGITTTYGYRADNGWLNYASSDIGSSLVYRTGVNHDDRGNVVSRTSHYQQGVGNLTQFTESYSYDSLNRLTNRSYNLSAGGTTIPSDFSVSQQYAYDGWGNFTFKTGAGYYQYDATEFHKLLGVYQNPNFSDSQYSFSYDANGNVTNDGKRLWTNASFDKPTLISQNGYSSSMLYGVSRELYYKYDSVVETAGTVNYATTYIGNTVKVVRSGALGNLTEVKHTIGDIVITRRSNNTSDIFYLHKDLQGSVSAVTDQNGKVITQAIYDPFGQRNAIYTDSLLANAAILAPTEQGYTGHKQLDGLGIIHMNGRVYDPKLGRFMQADPHVQAPGNSQSYNRYAYVLNNPMSYTDPSGYFFKSLKKLFKKIFRPLLAIVLSIVLPGIGGFFNGGLLATMVTGAIAGGVATGSLRGALSGAISGGLFHGIGAACPVAGAAKSVAHGLAGGISSVLNGGKFGHGFLSAGVTQGLSGTISRIDQGMRQSFRRVVASSIVGGTISALTGGKFANGTITGAFSRAFNDERHWSARDRAAAVASEAVYGVDNGGLLKELGVDYSPRHGLQAALSTQGDHYFLAFRGSEEAVDWRTNLYQGLAIKTSQYEQAISLAIAVDKATGGNLTITGHSLGGGLAAAAANATGGKAVTFNAAGLSRRYNTNGHGGIRAHIVKGDILSKFQNSKWRIFTPGTVGTRIYHDPINASDSAGKRHGLAHFFALP